jgi:hypothetical protein
MKVFREKINMESCMTVNNLNLNAENLIMIDSDNFDLKITMNEYENIKTNKDLMKQVAGHADCSSWSDFKEKFIEYQQKEFSFYWRGAQGKGGPIRLEKIELGSDIGIELAELSMDEKIEEGNLRDDIIKKKFLKDLAKYLGEKFSVIIDLQDVRTGFKSYEKDSQIYKYNVGRNNFEFKLHTSKYEFQPGKSRKREHAFGEYIKEKLKEELKLDYLNHSQLGREGGKFENDDLRGYKILRKITEDTIDMYNFELKPDNRIESISLAISQSVNYKSRANYTYVVMPNVSEASFHDTDRLASIQQICMENQIGLISIEMNNNEFDQVVIVTDPKRTNLDDESNLITLLDEHNISFCPLCRRFVDEERSTCGLTDSEGNCLRDKLEKM